MQDVLERLIAKNRAYTREGTVASYIPELKKADGKMLGVYVIDCDGESHFAGEHDAPFTIQSICKVPVFLCALLDNTMQQLSKTISMAPTADGFNSIVSLELRNNRRPLNPMINAGAIACLSMIKGARAADKYARVMDMMKRITGNSALKVNKRVFESELKTGDRNRALAYYMKSNGIIKGDVKELLDAYFMLCSTEVTCRDIAAIGVFLARGGVSPEGSALASAYACRIVKAVMSTCGMYDGSGDFAVSVGLPAKSGVGGGIMAVAPRRYGIGVFGPALDAQGNSSGGKMLLEDLSKELDLSVY